MKLKIDKEPVAKATFDPDKFKREYTSHHRLRKAFDAATTVTYIDHGLMEGSAAHNRAPESVVRGLVYYSAQWETLLSVLFDKDAALPPVVTMNLHKTTCDKTVHTITYVGMEKDGAVIELSPSKVASDVILLTNYTGYEAAVAAWLRRDAVWFGKGIQQPVIGYTI